MLRATRTSWDAQLHYATDDGLSDLSWGYLYWGSRASGFKGLGFRVKFRPHEPITRNPNPKPKP